MWQPPRVRGLVAWALGFVVLVALWPALCMSGEDEPTTCRSAVLLPLPWGEDADGWGIVAAVVASVVTVVLVRWVLRARVRR